jgi:hypothetical protein
MAAKLQFRVRSCITVILTANRLQQIPQLEGMLCLPGSTQGVDRRAISGLLGTLLEKDQPPARRIGRDKNRIGRVHRFSLRFRATP